MFLRSPSGTSSAPATSSSLWSAFVTGTDGPLSPFAGQNVATGAAAPTEDDRKLRSPLLTGIKGNWGKYAARGTRAILYIVRRQRQAKR